MSLLLLAFTHPPARAETLLPPVPVPAENPITEPKRLLGKILFWDEQLSSDNTVACGTCHRPASGGADPRTGRHPGADGTFGTDDDVIGSPGVAAQDRDGNGVEHPVFGREVQVTDRAAPSYLTGHWAEQAFWDGRAGPAFHDSLTGAVVIERGGALEGQALAPIMNPAEMAKQGREWHEVAAKLERAEPLALATDLPADVEAHLRSHDDYPALFRAAFGDGAITPVRIAFAIATYERTLIADETPWDVANRNGERLPARQHLGALHFETLGCAECHTPPLFTNNGFFNVGIRGSRDDQGRMNVTADVTHRGAMKVPSLRNAALKKTFMHTGEFTTLAEVVDAYADVPFADMAGVLPSGKDYDFNMTEPQRAAIIEFLTYSLTDPRVAEEKFPFDRPTLRSERFPTDVQTPAPPACFTATAKGERVVLRWETPADDTGVVDYRLRRDRVVIAFPTGNEFEDVAPPAGRAYRYSLEARDSQGNASDATFVTIRSAGLSPVSYWLGATVAAMLAIALGFRRHRRIGGRSPD